MTTTRQVKILLIHNKFRLLQPITWLSLFIRVFTCSKWNHIAVEQGDVVESIAKGVTPKPKEVWLKASDRIVQELLYDGPVQVDLLTLHGKPYGAFDLLRIGAHIIRVKWLGRDMGKIPHNSRGYVCSELAAVLIGLENPHLVTPADFEHLGLPKGDLYHTQKTK
jgi:hypothetical protein